jgi:hypothetical protein
MSHDCVETETPPERWRARPSWPFCHSISCISCRFRMDRGHSGRSWVERRRAAAACMAWAHGPAGRRCHRSHPLELFSDVAWDSYCPVNRLGDFIGETITTCGLVVEQRTHHQITGEPMKFLSLADWTGIVETELLAQTYKSYGLATIRYPVLEIEARVEPFENGRGFSLRALRAGKPRTTGGRT